MKYFLIRSYLPKNFEKQKQLITISSEESDDDDDVQINSSLSTPQVMRNEVRDVEDMLARQRALLAQSAEKTSRIPLPQQQLHSTLFSIASKPFLPPQYNAGAANQPVQAVQHRGIPPVTLPKLNLGLEYVPHVTDRVAILQSQLVS
jgi:hypothetical protein